MPRRRDLPRRICSSAALAAGGSVRFGLRRGAGFPGLAGVHEGEGFVLRAPDGRVHAYENVCPHRGQPVDLGDGRLFSNAGTLECQAHGAYFAAETGVCVGGACPGRALTRLPVEERAGAIWLLPTPPAPVDDP